MTELLLVQSALATSNSEHLVAEAAQIRSNCLARHPNRLHQENNNNDNNNNSNSSDPDKPISLLSCPECYASLIEAVRTRYSLGGTSSSSSTTTTTTAAATIASTFSGQQRQQRQQQQQQQSEWFAPRRAFLAALDDLLARAREYQIGPGSVDERVRGERRLWYAEQVRASGSLLRFLLPAAEGEDGGEEAEEALLKKLDEWAEAASSSARPVRFAKEMAQLLSGGTGGLSADGEGPGQGPGNGGVLVGKRMLEAGDEASRVEVLREAFFTAPSPSSSSSSAVPDEDSRKYLDMLRGEGLTMEQVVERIVEEKRAAAGAKGQIAALSQRLDELRRARAAYELQKQRRESLAQQRVPEEMYELPACAVCGDAPSARDFFCCTICAILAGKGVQPQKTVFCSRSCEEKGHASHAETHACSSASHCIQLQQSPETDGDTHMQEPPPASSELRFCTECLASLRRPTMWCSAACADADFQRHREEVHLPERKRLGLGTDDEGQLEYSEGSGDGGERRYRARDISTLTTSLDEAVREWEEKNRVRLQSLDL